MNASRHSTKQIAISGSLIVIVWLVFFWPVLSGQNQFGFRDTASMYQPLFQWIDQQWSNGVIPLWNPYDDFGVSVTGDVSSSVFYPGKLLFFLPGPSFELQFAWYVALHVLLAAGAAWWAARTIGCSVPAATLASISYAFGGTVVFQTCNVIYLVGAAWLPASLASAWLFSQTAHWRWLAAGSATLSMMVLGGDPQMAYVAGLVSLFLIWTTNGPLRIRWRITAPFLLLGFAVALSAIQVLPAMHWHRKSERANISPPVTVGAAIQHGNLRGLIQEPPAGMHAAAIYEFSFAPWRVVEAIWPNVLGEFDFATETRWASQLPGADRLWTPSIYFSVIVFLLACWQFRFRRSGGNRSVFRWQLTWISLFFVVASFGWYGLGWLINELQLMRGGSGLGEVPGRQVGGLYWVLVSWLPGFSYFRYPAKLIVVAALALCLLGGMGLQRLCYGDPRSVRQTIGRLWKCILVVSAAGIIISALMVVISFLPGDNIAGLQIISGGPNEILHSAGHSLIVIAALALLTWLTHLTTQSPWQSRVAWLVVLAAAIDLSIANRKLQGVVDAVSVKHSAVPKVDSSYRRSTDLRFVNLVFPLSLSDLRHADQLSLRPKYQLPLQQRVTGSYMSIEPVDLLSWKLAIGRLGQRGQILGAWGIQQMISSLTIKRANDLDRPIGVEIQPPGSSVRIRVGSTALDSVERFWLASQWIVIPECNSQSLITKYQANGGGIVRPQEGWNPTADYRIEPNGEFPRPLIAGHRSRTSSNRCANQNGTRCRDRQGLLPDLL